MSRTLLIPAPHVLRGRLTPYVPVGLLTLQAAAARAGLAVEILLSPAGVSGPSLDGPDALVEVLLGSIDLESTTQVGLSTVCDSFHHSLRLAQAIKQRSPRTLVILGGPQATAVSQAVLDVDAVDAVVEGEGEDTFVDLVRRDPRERADLAGIPGVRVREATFVPRPRLADLDALPDLTEAHQYHDAHGVTGLPMGSAPIEASRGCPGRCIFCSTRRFWGRGVRRKSAARLLSEMDRTHEVTGCTDFELVGDDFASPHRQFLAFCRAARDHRPAYTWRCDVRLSRLDEDDLARMERAGCRGFFVGLESASQDTLDRVRKGVRLDREIAVVRRAVEMGFEVHTSWIVGFPWETPADIRETYRMHCRMLRAGVFRSQLFALCPLPDTDLARDHPVRFDRWTSHIAIDGVPPDETTLELVRRHPSMFPQHGHFEAPRIDRPTILATRDAAAQMSAMHAARG